MLILSRRVNEAVVLGDQIIVSLVRLLPQGIEMTIRATTAGPSNFVKLGLGESADVGLGIRVRLVAVRDALACSGKGCDRPKARLGFEAPSDVRVTRHEVWPASGGGDPVWHFPKAGRGLSLN